MNNEKPETRNQKPKALGYYMPAEWQEHEGTWISWPKNLLTFPQEILKNTELVFLEMVSELSHGEKVFLLVDDEQTEGRLTPMLKKAHALMPNIIFQRIKSADVWTRDYSPIFLKNKENKTAATKWIYNAVGNKYEDLLQDNETGEKMAMASNVHVFYPGIVLEGGSIETNGKGILVTTEQCLLNKNRNPDLNKSQIEQYLKDYLGITKVIWLKNGIAGDDTDGHIDDFARFVNEKTMVCSIEEDPNDENYNALMQNAEILRKEGINIIALPMPGRIAIPERRLPASYANFYIGNKVVLLPVFKDKNDKIAIDIMKRCFPGRKIVPIHSTGLIYGYGGIHCATQQQPK